MNETFAVEIGAKRWLLPHLPFRLVMSIQPALFDVYSETVRPGAESLSPQQLDTLATAVWRALAYVEPSLSYEAFLALPFSVADLFAALPSVSQAVGLRLNTATAGASPEAGKSISTP